MPAGKHNLQIEQGAQFTTTFTWKDSSGDPVDLTSYSARIKFKEEKGGTELYDSNTNSDITLGGTAGTITLTIPTADTANFTFDNGLWDLEMTLSGEVTRLLEGRVYLSKEVTV